MLDLLRRRILVCAFIVPPLVGPEAGLESPHDELHHRVVLSGRSNATYLLSSEAGQ